MESAYFDSPNVARLQVLLDEVTRAKPGAPETRFVPPEGGLMERLESKFHHVLYGRRGTGKSSLLRRGEAALRKDQRLVSWADQETYVGLSYPDVLVSTLADTFAQFASQLRAGVPAREPGRFWRKPAPESERERLATTLEVLVAQLLDLKRQPSQSEVEWTASSSEQLAAALTGDASLELAKGPARVKAGGSRSTTRSNASTTGITQKFSASKAEHLEKAVTTYRAAMESVTKLVPDAYIILDDFYRLPPDDQPKIAAFHRPRWRSGRPPGTARPPLEERGKVDPEAPSKFFGVISRGSSGSQTPLPASSGDGRDQLNGIPLNRPCGVRAI